MRSGSRLAATPREGAGESGGSSGPDRRRDAERLLASHPQWSDRAIAQLCNLSSKTVATIRERSASDAPKPGSRVGRDGRVRPLDASVGRQRAAEIFAERPDASLREVSITAGVSVATARDVRDRLREGRTPTLAPLPRGPRRPETGRRTSPAGPVVEDRALRSSEEGRRLTEWLTKHAVTRADWQDFVEAVPVSRAYVIADLARTIAESWGEFAKEMERRARGS